MTSTSLPSTPCEQCGFQIGEPLARLSVSDLCFISDHRFPGRCVVTLRPHARELFELDQACRHAFIDDVSAAAQAIAEAVGAFKMNYEVLGNTDPHVHCHLIPRQRDEIALKVPAWLHPEAQRELPAARAAEVRKEIITALRVSQG